MQKISESVRNCFDSFKFLPTFSTQLYSTLRIKEKKTQFERHEGFRTKINYSCRSELKIALFDLPEPNRPTFSRVFKTFRLSYIDCEKSL